MIVRALTSTGDWTFGQGKNNYLSANAAITQNIQTRLSSFLGDCFFDATAGIDWFTFLGGKNATALGLAINATILNTEGVTGILQTSLNLSSARVFSVQYSVTTVYTTLIGQFQFQLNGIA